MRVLLRSGVKGKDTGKTTVTSEFSTLRFRVTVLRTSLRFSSERYCNCYAYRLPPDTRVVPYLYLSQSDLGSQRLALSLNEEIPGTIHRYTVIGKRFFFKFVPFRVFWVGPPGVFRCSGAYNTRYFPV